MHVNSLVVVALLITAALLMRVGLVVACWSCICLLALLMHVGIIMCVVLFDACCFVDLVAL